MRPRTEAWPPLAAAGAAALVLVVYLAQPWLIPWVRSWAASQVQTITGYTMLALLASLWLHGAWRQRLGRQPTAKAVHHTAGALLLVNLALHASVGRHGYLALQALLVLATAGLGLTLVWQQWSARTGHRHRLMAAHIALAGIVTATAAVHVYLVYAYAA